MVSAGNRKIVDVQGDDLITAEETSESSSWENELVCSTSII